MEDILDEPQLDEAEFALQAQVMSNWVSAETHTRMFESKCTDTRDWEGGWRFPEIVWVKDQTWRRYQIVSASNESTWITQCST